jgi:dipeptidyl aminopeptidase/acylaminoacyl peptidase
MSSLIIDREEIKLTDTHIKMVISGWGEEAYESTTVEKITYLSDSLKVKGYIAYPDNNHQKKFPCIIWNRGGYKDKGIISRFNARGIFGQIASWGYAVFASQYRGNDGGEGNDEFGGSDVNDILNLIPLAEEFSFADKDKWGIEGWSRGGMMTFLTLKRNNNFKCAVLSGAISDLKNMDIKNSQTANFYDEIKDSEKPGEELEKRSAIDFADELPKIPYLLIHGLADDVVKPEQSIELSKKFSELNIPHRLELLEEGDHYLKKYRDEVNEMRKNWFAKYLK